MTSLEADFAALGFGGYIINRKIQGVSWYHVLKKGLRRIADFSVTGWVPFETVSKWIPEG